MQSPRLLTFYIYFYCAAKIKIYCNVCVHMTQSTEFSITPSPVSKLHSILFFPSLSHGLRSIFRHYFRRIFSILVICNFQHCSTYYIRFAAQEFFYIIAVYCISSFASKYFTDRLCRQRLYFCDIMIFFLQIP